MNIIIGVVAAVAWLKVCIMFLIPLAIIWCATAGVLAMTGKINYAWAWMFAAMAFGSLGLIMMFQLGKLSPDLLFFDKKNGGLATKQFEWALKTSGSSAYSLLSEHTLRLPAYVVEWIEFDQRKNNSNGIVIVGGFSVVTGFVYLNALGVNLLQVAGLVPAAFLGWLLSFWIDQIVATVVAVIAALVALLVFGLANKGGRGYKSGGGSGGGGGGGDGDSG